MAERAHQKKGKLAGLRSLFDDLSFAQVVAGALAAVTSMLLASQIGIYGSAIGVGVGSVVSAVASQLYKKFLQRSADKLHELHPGETLAMGAKAPNGGEGAQGPRASAAEAGAVTGAESPSEATARLDAAETTELPAASSRGRASRVGDPSLSGNATVRRARAERRRKQNIKRGVVIVSIVSALLAVAASAFAIDFFSAGQGVGAKTEPILPSRSQPAATDDAPAASSDQGSSSDSSSSGTKDDSSKDASKDQGQDKGSSGDQGSSGSGSGSGTDSGSSSNSGSGSSGSDSSSGSGSGSGSGSDSGSSGGSTGSGGSSGGGSGSGGGDAGTGGNLSDSGGGSGSGSGSASGSTGSGAGAAGSNAVLGGAGSVSGAAVSSGSSAAAAAR